MKEKMIYSYSNGKIKFKHERKRLWLGFLFAVASIAICLLYNASIKATILFAGLFIVMFVFEIEIKDKMLSKIYYCIWTVCAACVYIFSMQLILNQGIEGLDIKDVILNICCCSVIFGVAYIFVSRIKETVLICGVFLMIFATVNYFVSDFRGTELALVDIFSARTALNVAGEYTFKINITILYAWIIFGIFFIGSIAVKGIIERGTLKKKIKVLLGMIILLLVIFIGGHDIETKHWLCGGTLANGFLLNFVLGAREIIVEKPGNYEYQLVNECAEEYEVPERDLSDVPHVIVIMDESFADVSIIGNEIQTNLEIMPFIDSLEENIIKGYGVSSVYGGNTPNSEWEVLTGNTLAFLPHGAIPYQQYVNADTYSMASVMSDLDYKCIGMHPYYANGWMRESVYPSLGFDESYFLDDFAQENLIRDYVSDQEMFEKIIDEYEQLEEDESLFLFGVTMQNHGGYEYGGENFEQEIELEGYSQEYPKVEQYLSLIHETDKAVEYLITYFESVDEDVVIMFYGDHFPALDEEFYEEVHGESFDTLDEEQLKYTVPFFIWANYDIEEEYVECTSLNYLSNYLYKVAGINWFFRNYPYHSTFAYISFTAKSALLHLPYIVRFTIFNLLFVPSTKPFESSLATEFSTASISFSNPFANRDISFKSEFLYRSINKYNRGILFFSYTSRNSRTQRINSLSLGYFCKIYAL